MLPFITSPDSIEHSVHPFDGLISQNNPPCTDENNLQVRKITGIFNFEQLNKELLTEFPDFFIMSQKPNDATYLFQLIITSIHQLATQAHIDASPPTNLNEIERLQWEAKNIKSLAHKLSAYKGIIQFETDLKKELLTYDEICKPIKAMLDALARFPDLATVLENILRNILMLLPSSHSQGIKWLSSALDQPTLSYIGQDTETYKTPTISIARHSQMVQAYLMSSLLKTPLNFSSYSLKTIEYTLQFFQTSNTSIPFAENALELLELANYLEASDLQKACCKILTDLFQDLNNTPEDIMTVKMCLASEVIQGNLELKYQIEKAGTKISLLQTLLTLKSKILGQIILEIRELLNYMGAHPRLTQDLIKEVSDIYDSIKNLFACPPDEIKFLEVFIERVKENMREEHFRISNPLLFEYNIGCLIPPIIKSQTDLALNRGKWIDPFLLKWFDISTNSAPNSGSMEDVD